MRLGIFEPQIRTWEPEILPDLGRFLEPEAQLGNNAPCIAEKVRNDIFMKSHT